MNSSEKPLILTRTKIRGVTYKRVEISPAAREKIEMLQLHMKIKLSRVNTAVLGILLDLPEGQYITLQEMNEKTGAAPVNSTITSLFYKLNVMGLQLENSYGKGYRIVQC